MKLFKFSRSSIIINNFIGMSCTGIAKVLSRSAIKSTVYLIITRTNVMTTV